MSATPLQRVLDRFYQLEGHEPRRSGASWVAPCPAHDDANPSLSIAEAADGRVLLKCHAGCNVESIVAALGLTIPDLFPKASSLSMPNTAKNGQRRIVATYDYCDEDGKLLFQVVRYEPKDFRQRRPQPGNGWDWSTKGVRKVPYRLPELLADSTTPVVVVEGEKDVDSLAKIGVLATCNAGGAGKWMAGLAEFLRGRAVFIVHDNDDAGRNHSQQVAKSLYGVAESVRIVELPGLPEKGDVSDWLGAGGTKEELMRLAEAAPVWTPAASAVAHRSCPVLTCLADVKPRRVAWLWPGRIPLGRITLLVGRPGEGKSFLTVDMAARVSTGTPWPDRGECKRGSVILISAEDDPADTIRPRLDAHYADVSKVHLLSAVRRKDDDCQFERLITLADVDAIEAAIKGLPDCRMIVVDPIGSFLGGRTDAHRDNEVRGVLAPIAALAEKHKCAVLVVAHRRKSTGSVADDLALGSRAFTGIARAVWHLNRDGDDKARRLLLPGKNNLARAGDGLAFTIIGEPPRVSWENDPVAMSADDALVAESETNKRTPGPDAEARESAGGWLRSALAGGPRLAKELLDEWKNGECGSERTLKRAKQSLEVKSYRKDILGPWWWRLPAKDANPPQDEQLGPLGILAQNTGDLAIFEADNSKGAKLQEPGTLGGEDRVELTI